MSDNNDLTYDLSAHLAWTLSWMHKLKVLESFDSKYAAIVARSRNEPPPVPKLKRKRNR